jgi:hypothetical protein
VKSILKNYLMMAAMLVAASMQVVAQDNRSGADEPPSSFPRIAYDERAWKAIQPTEGGFVVAFPGKPGFRTQTVGALIGDIVNHVYGLDIGVAFFAATYADMPVPIPTDDAERVNAAFDAGRDRMVEGARGRIISEQPIKLEGYAGRDLLYVRGDGGLVHNRSFIVGNRLYQLNVISDDYRKSSAEDKKFFKEIINRFFDSFKLTQKTY